jgi:hypothetical protein
MGGTSLRTRSGPGLCSLEGRTTRPTSLSGAGLFRESVNRTLTLSTGTSRSHLFVSSVPIEDENSEPETKPSKLSKGSTRLGHAVSNGFFLRSP